jgi:hypothetical protein
MSGSRSRGAWRLVVVTGAVVCALGVTLAGVAVASAPVAAPDAPTVVSVDDGACGDELFVTRMGPTGTVVKAKLATSDDEADLTARFALWPADRPQDRVEWTGTGRYPSNVAWGYAPAGAVQNGGAYAIAVRSERGDEAPSTWGTGRWRCRSSTRQPR